MRIERNASDSAASRSEYAFVGARYAVPSQARSIRLLYRSLGVSLILVFGFSLAIAQKNPPATPVNLNTATIAELEKLPGVGPETAKSIVDFRNRSGPFQRVEDLLAIRGISKAKLEKLRPYVTIASKSPEQKSSSSHEPRSGRRQLGLEEL